MAARRDLIVLEDARFADGTRSVRFAVWLTTPSVLVRGNPLRNSEVPAVSAATPWGITADELAAIRAGTITEVVCETGLWPAGTTDATWIALLTGRITTEQATLDARATGGVAYTGTGHNTDGTWTPYTGA
jgi:hypothetical protein